MILRGVALALAVGALVGMLFEWLRMPVPAPRAIEGVAGIVGIWLGALLVVLARRYLAW